MPVRELILLALESEESGWTPEDGPIDDLATTVRDILVKKAIILQEYYSFLISDDGRLLQLPLLLGILTQFLYNVTEVQYPFFLRKSQTITGPFADVSIAIGNRGRLGNGTRIFPNIQS